MISIVTAVFKATVGLLVNKGRDKAAERLKEGDVTDQKFRGMIVREIDDIKSKLDGLARKDLLASISFFKEGIELLYVVFTKARSRSEYGAITAQAAPNYAETFSLAKEMRLNLKFTGLDISAIRALDNAKKRFEDARRKATEAFANEALELSDRVLAMQYRVMSTIMESVDNPNDTLAACRVCIDELHSLPAVQKSFDVELKKGLRAWFNKDDRVEIISTVCHLNRVIYDVTQMATRCGEVLMLPIVDTGEEKVDPLRDRRVINVLHEVGMAHCCVPWSFGQEGDMGHTLKNPWGITTNTHGQFLIADNRDKTVKVFDSNGNFLFSFNALKVDADAELWNFHDVATDMENNTYVLASLKRRWPKVNEWEVWVFNKTAELQPRFFAVMKQGGGWGVLTVSGRKVPVLWGSGTREVVDVYEQNGEFVCSFGEGMFKAAKNFTATNDGRVMVLDEGGLCVHVFTVEGQKLSKLTLTSKEVATDG